MLDPVQITRRIAAIEKRLEFLRIEVPTVGGGGGAIGGTIGAGQVAYGTALDTIGGEAAFTYNAATNTLSVNYAGIGTAAPARRFAILESDAVTNAVTYATRVSHATSGAAAAGFGVGVEDELEDDGGTLRIAGTTETLWTDPAAATYTAARVWRLANGGAAATESLRLAPNRMTKTGVGTNTYIRIESGGDDTENVVEFYNNGAYMARTGYYPDIGAGTGGVLLDSVNGEDAAIMISGVPGIYLKNTTLYVGVGVMAPLARLHTVNETATTNAVMEVLRVEARVTGAGVAAAGFGPCIDLYGESATNTNYRQMACISATWTNPTDASRNAALSFETYPAGTAVGHSRFWSGTAIDGTAQTIIANATGDVTEAVTITYTVAEIAGTDTGGGVVVLEPGDSSVICSDGTNELTITCAVDGSVTIARSAGADTYKAALWLVWL